MKIIVLGGDGFCGWPTSLYLSRKGHDILIVDNLSRRKIDLDLGCDSLTPIQTITTRLNAWQDVTGYSIDFHNINVAEEYDELFELLETWKPDAVVHFAEQRSAPFSMKNPKTKRYTVDNNVNATNNLLTALADLELDIHVVHLGTMGVYGYGSAGMKIPEGYLRLQIEGSDGKMKDNEVLYPTNPGSVYHMSKTLDQLMFAYFNKNDGIRITDLHQGIVWGTQTEETSLDQRLINRFDYDGDFGTVLNRFLMQSAVGYNLTVHGTGGQTRAFIHIRDTVRCVELALHHPPKTGERVNIINQMTETHRIRDLAELVSQLTGVSVSYITNPRFEADENDLHVENNKILKYGLKPITLSEGMLSEIKNVAEKYAHRCNLSKIPCLSFWNQHREDEVKFGQNDKVLVEVG